MQQTNGGGTSVTNPTQTTAESEANAVKRNIFRASMLLTASVLLSRVIGFFREWILARVAGASAVTDVYFSSFTIPNFLNYLMAAGALSASFIPLLTSYRVNGQEELGKKVFRSLSTIIGLGMVVLVLFAEVLAGRLARVVEPGFTPDQLVLLTRLIRIILPAQLFFYWGGFAIAVQQTHGKFLTTAIAPIVYNAGIIAFGLLLYRSQGIAGFSFGVLIGAIIAQGVIQLIGVRRLGYSARPYFGLEPEIRDAIKRYLWLTFPIMLALSLVVTDEWISNYFASYLEHRALTWLYYGRTVMRIPIAVLGQVAGIASYPYLSKMWNERHYDDFAKTLLREIEKLWAAAPVAAILLVVHALPLIHFIYGGGKLSVADYRNTAAALQMFSLGVFFWTVQVLLARGFYACQRTWLPSIIGTLLSAAFIPVYKYLMLVLSFRGLALAGTLGIFTYTAILWFFLRRHLKEHAPEFSFKPFYTFCGLWIGALVLIAAVAEGLYRAHLYQGTRTSAALDLFVSTVVVGGIALGLLRTVYQRYTDGPLF